MWPGSLSFPFFLLYSCLQTITSFQTPLFSGQGWPAAVQFWTAGVSQPASGQYREGIPDGSSVLLPAARESAAPEFLMLLIRKCLKLNFLCNQPNPPPPSRAHQMCSNMFRSDASSLPLLVRRPHTSQHPPHFTFPPTYVRMWIKWLQSD